VNAMSPHARRWLAVARLEVLHLLHDRAALSLILAVPAVQILLFGYAVRWDPRHVPIAIAREEAAPEGALRRALAETGYFDVSGDGLPPGEAARAVAEHRALIGIELPPPLADPVDAPEPAGPYVLIDASDPAAVRPAALALEAAMWRHATTATHGYRIPPVRVEWLYNPQGRSSWAVVPSLAGVVVMISTLLLGALTLVRERERGTWEGLVATPISGIDALVGKLSPYVLIGIAQAGVVLGLAHLLFDLPFRGPLSALLFAAALLGVAHLVTGFAISALARTQVQAIQGAVFFYLPSMLLSGFIFPFSGMPSWAQHVGEALPLTHFVRAARAVTLRADGWSFVTPELVPIGIYALLLGALAVLGYRRWLE